LLVVVALPIILFLTFRLLFNFIIFFLRFTRFSHLLICSLLLASSYCCLFTIRSAGKTLNFGLRFVLFCFVFVFVFQWGWRRGVFASSVDGEDYNNKRKKEANVFAGIHAETSAEMELLLGKKVKSLAWHLIASSFPC